MWASKLASPQIENKLLDIYTSHESRNLLKSPSNV